MILYCMVLKADSLSTIFICALPVLCFNGNLQCRIRCSACCRLGLLGTVCDHLLLPCRKIRSLKRNNCCQKEKGVVPDHKHISMGAGVIPALFIFGLKCAIFYGFVHCFSVRFALVRRKCSGGCPVMCKTTEIIGNYYQKSVITIGYVSQG